MRHRRIRPFFGLCDVVAYGLCDTLWHPFFALTSRKAAKVRSSSPSIPPPCALRVSNFIRILTKLFEYNSNLSSYSPTFCIFFKKHSNPLKKELTRVHVGVD